MLYITCHHRAVILECVLKSHVMNNSKLSGISWDGSRYTSLKSSNAMHIHIVVSLCLYFSVCGVDIYDTYEIICSWINSWISMLLYGFTNPFIKLGMSAIETLNHTIA